MNKKTTWLLIGIVVIAIIGIVSYIVVQSPAVPGEVSQPGATVGEGLAELPAGTPEWLNPDKPMESPPTEENKIPKTAIKIGVSAAGFSPKTFEVKTGQTVTLSITSKDQWTHVFKFRDTNLSNIAVGVAPGESRMITFIAPKKIGDYDFFCDVPGHSARGETGKMIVE